MEKEKEIKDDTENIFQSYLSLVRGKIVTDVNKFENQMSFPDQEIDWQNFLDFDTGNASRNLALQEAGMTMPNPMGTGTTICGMYFKDGLILGCDSLSTQGGNVGDKHCDKLHKITNKIYAAGAGTAGDLQYVADLISGQMKLIELNTGRPATVMSAVRYTTRFLHRYGGHVGAYLIIAGVDSFGAHLVSIAANGSSHMNDFMCSGSGSYPAGAVLERKFRHNMEEEEALAVMREAVEAGMHADLASGSMMQMRVIYNDLTKPVKMTGLFKPGFCVKPEPIDKKYKPPKNSVKVKFVIKEAQKEDKMEID